MKILMIGDVVSSGGREILCRRLPGLIRYYGADITIVNGENSADGNGIILSSAEEIFAAGADVITGGNHTFRRREIYTALDENSFLLRPANYPDSAPGTGMCIVDKGAYRVAVISLMGQVYMSPQLACPFKTADRLIAHAQEEGCNLVVVDFHAEATGEKRSLGFYLDGRVTAVCGTHTHVRTADEEILPGGTGYISDLGMTGPEHSVLGVKPELTIAMMKDKLPVRFENASGECMVNGCIITADRKTGKCTEIEGFTVR